MAWSTIKTQGVVLRVDPIREFDRRYRMLTPTHGKIEFVGRGAQKGKAKLASHLEPFAIVDIEIVLGRRRTTVISVERQHVFRCIAASLDLRLLAQSSLALLDRYTREDDQDEALYQELLDWLYFLDQDLELGPARRTFFLGGFILRCFKHLGYHISIDTCLSCKQKILPLAFRWHSGKGGLVCSECIGKDKDEWFSARPMSEEVVTLLRFARDADYQNMLKLPLSGDLVEEFAKVVHDLVTYHLPGDFEVPFWSGVLGEYEVEVPKESV
ncbi:DNA repair protein RecO [Patescibacteria group bacterium]|nr:DNA repair protein RecO [Patescibacteria group bacterium]